MAMHPLFAEICAAHGMTERACVRCGSTPIRDTLDGDDLCQACCDQWARGERPDPAPMFTTN